MRRYTLTGLATAMLMALLALCACTDDELTAAEAEADTESSEIVITYDIAPSVVSTYTRTTTEDDMKAYASPWGDTTWDETAISRLDLFIFQANTESTTDSDSNTTSTYSLKGHYYTTTSDELSGTWQVYKDDAYTNAGQQIALSYDFIEATDSIYLIANVTDYSTTSPQTSTSTDTNTQSESLRTRSDDDTSTTTTTEQISTPTDLQYLIRGYSSCSSTYATGPRGPRGSDGFTFCGRLSGADATTEAGKNRKTFKFSLVRSMAKACIRIYYKDLDGSAYTQLYDFAKKNIYLQLKQYPIEGAVCDNGVKPSNYTRSEDSTVTIETGYDSTGKHYILGTFTTYTYTYGTRYFTLNSENDISAYDISSSSSSSLTTEVYRNDTTTTTLTQGNCAVYYLYPNDWLNMNLVSNIKNAPPIFDEYQTYIQMSVLFDNGVSSTALYKYKVPFNYLLPSDNDDQDYAAVEATQHDTIYKELYRIYPNRIYNVNVYIAEQETGLYVGFTTDSSVITDLDYADGSVTINEDDLIPLGWASVTYSDSDSNIVYDLTEGSPITTVPDSGSLVTDGGGDDDDSSSEEST